MSDENTNRAYAEGLKLKNSNWDEDAIYAKLEKKGFSPELSRQVAEDIMIERNKSERGNKQIFFNLGIGIMAFGAILFLVTLILTSGWFIFPGGLIMGGAITAALNVPSKKH